VSSGSLRSDGAAIVCSAHTDKRVPPGADKVAARNDKHAGMARPALAANSSEHRATCVGRQQFRAPEGVDMAKKSKKDKKGKKGKKK
jgi:hypothetical protein